MSQIASIEVSKHLACLKARTGAFVLPAAQALALHPKHASSIRITCGSAWVTFDNGKDYLLGAGQEIVAPAGSRVVMESMQRGSGLKFDWQPAQATASPLTQALRDLRGAAGLATRGLAGLATALGLGLATGLAALARRAHPSANCAQGRMAS